MNPTTYGGAFSAGKNRMTNKILAGIDSVKTIDIKLGDVWVINEATNEFTKITEATSISEYLSGTLTVTPETPTDTTGCTVTKLVKEVYYTIEYEPYIEKSKSGFVISSVILDFIF